MPWWRCQLKQMTVEEKNIWKFNNLLNEERDTFFEELTIVFFHTCTHIYMCQELMVKFRTHKKSVVDYRLFQWYMHYSKAKLLWLITVIYFSNDSLLSTWISCSPFSVLSANLSPSVIPTLLCSVYVGLYSLSGTDLKLYTDWVTL